MFRPALRRAIFPYRYQSFHHSVQRCFATHAAEQPPLHQSTTSSSSSSSTAFDEMEKESEKKEPTKNEALRPTLKKKNAEDKGIEVDPNHGLFNFFRKVKDDAASSGFKYITVEPTNDRLHARSRAWTTAELRRKSFRDLHIIWYMCQRERNLLATQKAELRRLHHLASVAATPITLRARM
ncbi:54S ribosomal protein L4 mitochondrial, partial [Serendipita sp. 399]